MLMDHDPNTITWLMNWGAQSDGKSSYSITGMMNKKGVLRLQVPH